MNELFVVIVLREPSLLVIICYVELNDIASIMYADPLHRILSQPLQIQISTI